MRFISVPLRNLRQRPMRSTLTALGMSTAIAGFVALVGMSRGLERAWTASLTGRGRGAEEGIGTTGWSSLAGYHYLWFSLVLLLAWGVVYARRIEERRSMIYSSLLSTPYSLASEFFVPAYWQPLRLAEVLTWVEDLIFSFATGGIVWAMAVTTDGDDSRARKGPAASFFAIS